MRISRNKTKAASIAFVLMLTMTAALITCVPVANAEDVTTYPFLTVTPNPVGVGQPLTINMWLNLMLPFTGYFNYTAWWYFTVAVTKPDGTITTLGPYKSDPVGAAWTTYTPDTVGTYTFQISFNGTTSIATPTRPSDYYKPSTTPKISITVQQQPIAEWPAAELPTDYWSRPINAMNRE
jgi:hypothetical protein